MLTITPIYVGLLAILFFWQSLRISLKRLKGFGSDDSKKEVLRLAVRAQGNSSEYIPLGLIILLVLELQGAPGGLVHVFGIALLAGRLGHFAGFDLMPHRLLRQVSIVLTYAVMCFGGLAVLWFALVS